MVGGELKTYQAPPCPILMSYLGSDEDHILRKIYSS